MPLQMDIYKPTGEVVVGMAYNLDNVLEYIKDLLDTGHAVVLADTDFLPPKHRENPAIKMGLEHMERLKDAKSSLQKG